MIQQRIKERVAKCCDVRTVFGVSRDRVGLRNQSDDPRGYPHIQPRRYLLIDALLNHNQYGLLGKVLGQLEEKLGEKPDRE